ncbi:MAG: phosphohydrolase [Rubrivivax sp.]|nr:phosphohydrolase [Rubrivivax sp.]
MDSGRVLLSELLPLLRTGEPVGCEIRDPLDRLLLSAGHVIASDRQLEQLVERGAWVLAADAAALRAARGGGPAATGSAPGPTLFARWEQAVWSFDRLARRLLRREAVAAEIDALADEIAALVERDTDIALFLAMRQDERRFALYALTHSIHAAVLVRCAARQLAWPDVETARVLRAALTMNVATVELQAVLAEQPFPPTGRQMEQIRAHPARSVELLRAAGVNDEGWLAAVADHHQRSDGSGYPRGVREVPATAQLVRMADVFLAKISPRAKRPAIAPQVASKQLFQQEPGSGLAVALIKSIGVHPPGSLVELASGEIGVVTRRAAVGGAAQVAALTDARGQPAAGTRHRDSARPEFAIRGVPGDTAVLGRVLPERVYGLVAG